MYRWHVALTCVALAASPGQSSAQPAVSPRDSAAISQLRSDWVAAIRARDGKRMATLVTDSVVTIGNQPTRGRAAFEAFWVKFFDGTSGPNPYVVYPKELRVVGDSAFERGEFGPEGGPSLGGYIFGLKRERGDIWRISFWRRYALTGTGTAEAAAASLGARR